MSSCSNTKVDCHIPQREQLLNLIEKKALQRGDFTLRSGKKSSYYLDCRNVTLDPLGTHLIGTEIVRMLSLRPTFYPDSVGGLAVGADPITTSVVMASYCISNHVGWLANLPKPIQGFIVRKEVKGHGVGDRIAGPLEPGMSTVIVEDVCTTGHSALEAARCVEEFGCEVKCIIGLVDRLEGAEEAVKEAGHTLLSLFTIKDFGIQPPIDEDEDYGRPPK